MGKEEGKGTEGRKHTVMIKREAPSFGSARKSIVRPFLAHLAASLVRTYGVGLIFMARPPGDPKLMFSPGIARD